MIVPTKYLLSAALLVLLAGCGTDTTAEQAQAKVDSIANAKLTLLQNRQRRNNDSIINALAAARADSIMKQSPAPARK